MPNSPFLSIEQAEKLAEKMLSGTITPEEQVLLDEWAGQEPGDQLYWPSGDADKDALKSRLLTRIRETAGLHQPDKSIPLRRWLAAASVILLLGIGIFMLSDHISGNKSIAAAPQDIAAPSVNRARITFAGGQTVYLDSAVTGLIATQGNTQLVKLADGQIAYKAAAPSQNANQEIVYNTITNPRGSRVIHMTLADGSQVWLNAASSLRYPNFFTGSKRMVEITGEAYLEIAANPSQPFIVKKQDAEVQVLGTRFNFNSYEEENLIRVTLFEGSVKVAKGNSSGVLQPGQQAQLNKSVKVVDGVDLEEVIAWKNGLFKFNQTDIQTVMRQISRWYDVDISYPQGIPRDVYWGALRRDLKLSSVLRILQESGAHYTIEGNKVTVLPH